MALRGVGPESEAESVHFYGRRVTKVGPGSQTRAAAAYREAFKKRRCLIPADGFYEWKKVPGGKIPYSIGMKDHSPFVFAGLWETWKDPSTDEWLQTCTIITGEPNNALSDRFWWESVSVDEKSEKF